jgi:hypothetical protein
LARQLGPSFVHFRPLGRLVIFPNRAKIEPRVERFRSAAPRFPKPPCAGSLCPRTLTHNTRRYGHPFAGGLAYRGAAMLIFAFTEFSEVGGLCVLGHMLL